MNGRASTFSSTPLGTQSQNAQAQAKDLDTEGDKKKILATGSEVRRQVLLPAAEKQAWKRKEVGRFNGGRLGIWVSRW